MTPFNLLTLLDQKLRQDQKSLLQSRLLKSNTDKLANVVIF